MKKRVVIVVLLLILLLPCVAVIWLGYSQSGLQFALAQLKHIPNINVQTQGISGRLAGPLHIDYFELDHERIHIVARQIDIDLNSTLLVSGWIALHSLKIEQVSVTLKRRTHESNNEPINFLPSFIHVSASAIRINHAAFNDDNGFNIEAAPALTRLSLSRRHLLLSDLDVQGTWFAAQGQLRLDSAAELALTAHTAATLVPTHGPALHGNVEMSGTTKLLKFSSDIQQPQVVHADATLSFPDNNWLFSGQVTSQRLLISPWVDNAPISFSNAQLDFKWDDAGIRVLGDTVVPEWSPLPLHINTEARYAARVITLKRTDISTTHGIHTHTTGTIKLVDAGSPELDLRLSWQQLQWPLQDQPAAAYFSSTQGAATIKGALPYQFTVDTQLAVPQLSNSKLIASGQLSSQQVALKHFEWQALNGITQGSAQLSFAKPRHWQFAVQTRDINPGLINDSFPGQLTFNAHGAGEEFNPHSDFDITLQGLTGTLRNQSLHGQAHILHRADLWQADHVAVNWGEASITANGSVDTQNNLHWHVVAPKLQQLYPALQGQVVLSGELKGTHTQPYLALIAQGTALSYAEWKLNGLKLDTEIDLSDKSASQLQLDAAQLSYGAYTLQRLNITANGNSMAHDLTIRGAFNSPQTGNDEQLLLETHGRYQNQLWQAQLNKIDVQANLLDKRQSHVTLVQPTQLAISHDQAKVSEICLHIDSGQVCAAGNWQPEQWQIKASVDKLPLVLSNSAWADNTRLLATVDANMDFHQVSNQPWLGTAQLTLSDASVRYQVGLGHEALLPINTGTMRLDATTHAVHTTAQLNIADNTIATLDTQLNRAVGTLMNWPLTGQATLQSADAKLVPVFVHEIDRAAGTLTARVDLSGTLAAPLFSGNVQFAQGELDFYRLNLALRALQLDAALHDDQMHFTAQGNVGDGTLQANGDLNWRDNQLAGKLQLKGQNLLVADLPEYHILASPDLSFDIVKLDRQTGTLNISGEVAIPSARLQPRDITGAVQLSPDARFKTDKVFERGSGWSVTSKLDVRLGDDVQFNGLGLQGKLGGGVETSLRSGEPATGRGELSIDKGRYEAYGRKLDIKRGRLIFDGTPLDNPGLDIQAERVITENVLDEITVGVNVHGVLRNPRLEFYSDPSMSQTQIVSYLIVGKPLDELQGQEASSVRSASSSLAIQGGGYLAGQLGHYVGLEEVGVETDTNNQSALVLGKFLSPRLYVSYGISLTQAINTLKLRYSLNNHWSIKTEAGEAMSADVEFKIEH